MIDPTEILKHIEERAEEWTQSWSALQLPPYDELQAAYKQFPWVRHLLLAANHRGRQCSLTNLQGWIEQRLDEEMQKMAEAEAERQKKVSISEEAARLLRAHQAIRGIKQIQRDMGLGLREAKALADRWREQNDVPFFNARS